MFLSDKERTETIWACRFCIMCHVADRVASLVRRESYTPRGRGAILFAIDRGLLELDDAVADIMYTTLNDGSLREWCVGNYDHEDLVLDARAKIFQRGLAPERVLEFVKGLLASQGRGTNLKDILSKAGVNTESGAEILLFCGCSPGESQTATIVAMGKLFNQADCRFQVLSNEPCCGWPLYQLGDLEGAGEFSINVAEKIKASGAIAVAVLEADCYRMLLTRNARFGGDLKGIRIVHVTSLLADWIEEGRIKVTKKISDSVTYHDPCALARYCEDMDSPRKIFSAVLDRELKEMDENRKHANCCGAGGMLEVHRPDLTNQIALSRLEEARRTGASILATACLRCDATFKKAINSRKNENGLRIMNLVDLVALAAGIDKD